MSTKSILLICAMGFAFPLIAQAQNKLAAAKAIKCTFPLNAVGTWKSGKPEAEMKQSKLVLEFSAINTDEGSAQLDGGTGTFDMGRCIRPRFS